ncbi:MAG: hypothetical protein U0136_21535 [Bdellovibrionota bacterium]
MTIKTFRECANCSGRFTIEEKDTLFYHRMEVPLPTWCPECRHIRRHGHVNDYVYYTRTCSGCQRRFVSTFPASSSYRVLCQACWYSDSRDDKGEGRDYDFRRPFFEQFDELMHAAPQMGIIAINTENSEYCESIADCKNTYLISECSNCEDCMYSYWIQKSRDCVDTCYLHECERSYQISDCVRCYALKYSSDCEACSESLFLSNCMSCANCAFCVNLRHKQFCFFNEQLTQEDYMSRLAALHLERRSEIARWSEEFQKFLRANPVKHLQMEHVEGCAGDYVRSSKNCTNVYHCYDAEDCRFGEHVWRGAKNCMDVNTAGRGAELIYEATNTNMGAYFTKFARYCWGCRFTEYSNMCINGSYLFGCVGLKSGAQYCILNKEYTKSEYAELVPQIKAQMMRTGDYGEFFPLSISLFGYNNSVSYDDRPYSKDDVLRRGWKWENVLSGTLGKETVAAEALSQSITDISASICDETLSCVTCSRNYRITKQELRFYLQEGVPVPTACPDCRHRQRLGRRRRKRFRTTTCSECGEKIQTTLDPQEFQRICCESCYKEAVYGR